MQPIPNLVFFLSPTIEERYFNYLEDNYSYSEGDAIVTPGGEIVSEKYQIMQYEGLEYKKELGKQAEIANQLTTTIRKIEDWMFKLYLARDPAKINSHLENREPLSSLLGLASEKLKQMEEEQIKIAEENPKQLLKWVQSVVDEVIQERSKAKEQFFKDHVRVRKANLCTTIEKLYEEKKDRRVFVFTEKQLLLNCPEGEENERMLKIIQSNRSHAFFIDENSY